MALVEVVANVSEGRDSEVVERIAGAAVTAGASLLDTHSDPDHHRSVLTLAGPPEVMPGAARALAQACLETIDITSHMGVHPRFGALDVCPFVPLDAADPGEAARVALDAATRATNAFAALGLPVFHYDLASAAGRSLPDLRRGAFSGFGPDAGPMRPHPTAGAVAVGVRGILVAYNIDLATDDFAVARRVAFAVRAVNGGPAGLRALAFELDSQRRTQISMNLVRPDVTGLAEASRAVSDAARAEGVDVAGDELVGLVPAAAARELPPTSTVTAQDTIEARLAGAGLRAVDAPPLALTPPAPPAL